MFGDGLQRGTDAVRARCSALARENVHVKTPGRVKFTKTVDQAHFPILEQGCVHVRPRDLVALYAAAMPNTFIYYYIKVPV